MKQRRRTDRGQVLIIFVFAIIGLIGITGLAIDGSNIFSDRRHAQNAADTAAMTAALTRNKWEQKNGDCSSTSSYTINTATSTIPSCASGAVNNALNIAASNGYVGNPATETSIHVYSPPITGPYASDTYTFDNRNYIQVIINSSVETWFAKILGIGRLHNRVEAVALADYSAPSNLYGGNSLVELRPSSGPGCGTDLLPNGEKGGGDVYLGGSSGLILSGGGIFVNSDNPTCALKITNTCPQIQLTNGATIQGLGGQFAGCTPPVLQKATEGYPYPPAGPPVAPIPPAACAGNAIDTNVNPGIWNDIDKTWHFGPGHYTKLPPERNTTLNPGVYCVDDLIKTTNSYKFYGDGVFMYVRSDGDFSFNGGTIQLVAPGMLFPGKSAPAPVSAATDPYKGFLIYVDETDWNSTAEACVVDAGSDTILRGVIYAPHCGVTINGSSGTIGLTAQVIAYTLKLTGDAVLNFIYNDAEMPSVPEMNLTGLYR